MKKTAFFFSATAPTFSKPELPYLDNLRKAKAGFFNWEEEDLLVYCKDGAVCEYAPFLALPVRDVVGITEGNLRSKARADHLDVYQRLEEEELPQGTVCFFSKHMPSQRGMNAARAQQELNCLFNYMKLWSREDSQTVYHFLCQSVSYALRPGHTPWTVVFSERPLSECKEMTDKSLDYEMAADNVNVTLDRMAARLLAVKLDTTEVVKKPAAIRLFLEKRGKPIPCTRLKEPDSEAWLEEKREKLKRQLESESGTGKEKEKEKDGTGTMKMIKMPRFNMKGFRRPQ